MKTIQNEKAAGVFAVGFKYTVLEATEQDGGLHFFFATPIYENYRPKKMNHCTMEIEMGCMYQGYAKCSFSWVGEIEKRLKEAQFVSGKTYDIKEELKPFGFSWNRETKRWEK